MNAETQAATPACQAAGGSLLWDGSVLYCEGVAYLGNDGSTYQAEAEMSLSTGGSVGPINTAGTGASQQECSSGYYPNLSSGPGYGAKGTWNPMLEACIPG